MKSVLACAILAILVVVPVNAQDNKAKPDPLTREFASPPAEMFAILGRAVTQKWRILHSDKDLCLVTFEQAQTMTSSGWDATATCEPSGTGSRVRVKARQKGDISTKGREERFAKGVLDEVEKQLEKK